MSSKIEITALGHALDLECVGARAEETHAALAARWSLCARPPGTPAQSRLLVDLGGPPSRDPLRVTGDDPRQLLVTLTQAVTHVAIGGGIGHLLMFHAAGLSNHRTGASAVLVAPGGTGKTTACRTLGRGRGYLSDETIGIAADATITDYPKPLSVRRPGLQTKDEIDPVGAGLTSALSTPFVRAVLLIDRDPDGPDQPEVERLDPFEALTEVAPETSSLEELPRPLHRLHDLLGSVELTGRVRYREAASLEPLLSSLIGPPERMGRP